jgi:putative GTP pyrophosphokinase
MRETKLLERKLGVIHRLEHYAHITQQITRKKRGVNFDWYVLQILPDAGRVIVRGFPLQAFDDAKDSLISLEAKFKGTKNQAVLVAAASLNELRRAYPNYFADTKFFIEMLRSFVRYAASVGGLFHIRLNLRCRLSTKRGARVVFLNLIAPSLN